MADKKKLSKDVEEQIQSLASDVYIQIEEKLTQLISTSTTDQPAKKINIEEEPAYLSLQNDFNVSQNELAQSLKTQQQLQQDITTQQAIDKKIQTEISKSKVDYAKSLDSLEQENKALKTELTQTQDKISNEQQQLESTLNEQTSQLQTSIEVLSQENNHLKSQLQQKQNNLDEQSELQRSSLADNAQRLNEKQEEISKLTDQLAEFSKQEQSLKEHIEIIEQQRINSDEKLNTSTTTWQENEEQLSATLVEQKQQITDLKNQLISAETDSRVIQDKYNTQIEMANSDFEQKITLLNSELQHAQSESNDQRIKLAEQQEKLTFLEDQIKVHVKTSQDYKQELSLLNDQQTKLKDQQLAEKESRLTKENQLQKIQEEYQQTIAELESKNQSLADGIITEQSEAKLYQKEIESLKSQVKLAQDGQESLHNRFNANREKQERENDQVRETIKYLRDENSEMITQHNEKKEQFLEQIHELESKLTEYRLKFEYAQKQLTQKN